MLQLTSFSVIRDLVHWWVPSLPPNKPVRAATACLPRTPAKPPSTICYATFRDEAHTSWPRHMQRCNPALKSCLSVHPTASTVTVGDMFFPCLCLAACVFDSAVLLQWWMVSKLGCCCLLQSSKGLLSTGCGGSPLCPWLLVWFGFLCSILTFSWWDLTAGLW